MIITYWAGMREEGLLKANARFFATRGVHDANPPSPDLVNFAA
jgi:hypothetical protein